MASKGKNKASRKREQIRSAAYLCFRDSGYHDTSVDAICTRSGISKGSFYWHYSAKQDVFIDILETWAREVMDELYEQFEEAMNQSDYIAPLTSALEREIHRGRALVPLWLEFTVYARRESEVQEKLSKFYRRARAAITEILRPALEGKFSEKEMQSISATIFGAYTGLMIQDLSDPERANAREVVRRFMGVVEWWLRQVQQDMPISISSTVVVGEGERLDKAELSNFLSGASPAVAAHFEELRALVLHAAPESDESIKPGWKVIAYDRSGLIVSLKPKPKEVVVSFYRGALLPDPGGLLQGKGKLRRHVVSSPDAPLDPVIFKDLLEAAVTFQRI